MEPAFIKLVWALIATAQWLEFLRTKPSLIHFLSKMNEAGFSPSRTGFNAQIPAEPFAPFRRLDIKSLGIALMDVALGLVPVLLDSTHKNNLEQAVG